MASFLCAHGGVIAHLQTNVTYREKCVARSYSS